MSSQNTSLKAPFFEAFAERPRPAPEKMLQPAANAEGKHLCELLVAKTTRAFSPQDIQSQVEGNLWMLTAEAFVALQQAHGADFPCGELQTAIDRFWARFHGK